MPPRDESGSAAIVIDAPRFSLTELGELRHALNQASLYVGPVGNPHASCIWKEARHWVERLHSLIEETKEWEAEIADE